MDKEQRLAESHTGETARITSLHDAFEQSLSASLDAKMLLPEEQQPPPPTPLTPTRSDGARGEGGGGEGVLTLVEVDLEFSERCTGGGVC